MGTLNGIAFPYSEGDTSFPAQATDADVVKQSIIQILLTGKQERVMRPQFGCGLMSRVFDNNNEMLEVALQAEIYGAIGKWEPRAIVRNVSVVRNDSTASIQIDYVVTSTRQADSVSLRLNTP